MDGALRMVIGVDEAGKGDFFGPLVVAAFAAGEDDHRRLVDLGVRDSKRIADKKLLGIDQQLRVAFAHAVLVLNPAEYNQSYASVRNLNKLLARQHACAIEMVLSSSRADSAVSDKFGKDELVQQALRDRGMTIPLRQVTGGEAILQVAAASILARAAFVRSIDALSEKYKCTIPKGAAPIVDAVGRDLVRRHGPELLPMVAKIHFKNYHRVVNPVLDV